MRKAINSIILFLLVLMLISCEGISIDSENTVYEKGPIVSGRGTIIFLDFEGGCWGIVGDDGKHYYPLGLIEDFKIDGLRVYFKKAPF